MDESEPLIHLVDEGRAGQTGEQRERERALQRMAEEGASLVGTLLDLAERRSAVSLRTTGGRAQHGTLEGVGADFVVLRSDRGGWLWIRTAAVVTVRPHPDERHRAASGDRPAPLDRFLADALADLAVDRPRLAIVATGGETVAGELRAVGSDVLTLRLDGERRAVCYVSLDAVVEVALER